LVNPLQEIDLWYRRRQIAIWGRLPAFWVPLSALAVSWFDERLVQRELLGPVVTNDFSDRSQGIGFGIGAGYLFQTSIPNILVGASASLDVLKLDTLHTIPGGFFLGQNTGVIGALKAQAGVVAAPNVLVYGEVGPAFINIDQKLNFVGPVTAVNRTVPGVDFGAGIAFQPAGLQVAGIPLAVFTQINYIILRAETYDNPGSPLFRYRNNTDITRVGFGVRLPIGGGSQIKRAEQRGAR
jgi:hypothetical protein